MARPYNPRRVKRRRRPEREPSDSDIDVSDDDDDDGATSDAKRHALDADDDHDHMDDVDIEPAQMPGATASNASPCSWWVWALVAALVAALVSLRLSAGLNIDALESGGDNDVDLYSVLNVGASSSQTAIRSAYRNLALKLHPDKCTSEQCRDRLHQVQRAHEVLGDAERRRQYDASSTAHDPIASEALDLSDEEFDAAVLHSDALWFIFVYAEWAPGVARMAQAWEHEVARLRSRTDAAFLTAVRFGRVHVLRQSDLFLRLPVAIRSNALPTVLSHLRTRSRPWQRFIGAASQLDDFVADELPAVSSVTSAAEAAVYLDTAAAAHHTTVIMFTKTLRPSPVLAAVALQFDGALSFVHCLIAGADAGGVIHVRDGAPTIAESALPALLIAPAGTLDSPTSWYWRRVTASTLISSAAHIATSHVLTMSASAIRSMCIDGAFDCMLACHNHSSSSATTTTTRNPIAVHMKRALITAIKVRASQRANKLRATTISAVVHTSAAHACAVLGPAAPAAALLWLQNSDAGRHTHILDAAAVFDIQGDNRDSSGVDALAGALALDEPSAAANLWRTALVDWSTVRRPLEHRVWFDEHCDALISAAVLAIVVALMLRCCCSPSGGAESDTGSSTTVSIVIAVLVVVSMLVQNEKLFKILAGNPRAFDDK